MSYEPVLYPLPPVKTKKHCNFEQTWYKGFFLSSGVYRDALWQRILQNSRTFLGDVVYPIWHAAHRLW
jgi:hypothetical protein